MPSKKRASRKKKGSKGKENKKQQKKLQREAELAAEKLRTEVVATANAAEDPMAKFLPFKTFKVCVCASVCVCSSVAWCPISFMPCRLSLD